MWFHDDSQYRSINNRCSCQSVLTFSPSLHPLNQHYLPLSSTNMYNLQFACISFKCFNPNLTHLIMTAKFLFITGTELKVLVLLWVSWLLLSIHLTVSQQHHILLKVTFTEKYQIFVECIAVGDSSSWHKHAHLLYIQDKMFCKFTFLSPLVLKLKVKLN